jgi:hypothetical protein
VDLAAVAYPFLPVGTHSLEIVAIAYTSGVSVYTM